MNILAFTTRDYYDIVNSKCWDIIECPQLIDFISNLYDGDTVNKDRNVRKFFQKDDEAVGFWEENRETFTFTMRKHKNADVYIIPCIPKYHLYGEGKCKSQKVRQDYIGTFLNCVLSRIKDVKADDIFVAVHDLDIFINNDERSMNDEDLVPDSVLSRLIKEGSIKIEHIFGFQHENGNGHFYTLFNQKMDIEILPKEFYANITKKILDFSKKKTNRELIVKEGVSTKKIATSPPITPIQFTFTIDPNGKFICTMPDSYNDSCYHEYYVLVNAIKDGLEKKILEGAIGDYSTFLLIHHIDDVRECAKRQEQYVFGQNYFIESGTICPVIHFCDASLEDMTEIYRYASVIDCSIWNHYVQIKRNNESSTISFVDEVQLENAISDIANNSSRHLYNLVVARESADLVARMTYASFIKHFPETTGHADYVSPFVFHSEQAVKNNLIYEEFEKTNKVDQIKNQYRWRILLIDDKAIADMDTNLRKKNIVKGLPFNCKVTIIKNVLNRYFDRIHIREWKDSSPIADGTECLLEFAQSKIDAVLALQKRKYDIILLDYLLERSPEGNHNYGYQILETIYGICDSKAKKIVKDNPVKNIQIGPNRRLFFMFTSAYSSAVNERLLAEGLNLSEDYWHISLGACPTNTPQLFLYNLIKLMEKRLEDSGIENLSAMSIYKIVKKIFQKEISDEPSVRHKANDYYQEVLDMQYYYRKMLDDVQFPADGNIFNTTGSVLITDFIGKNVYLGGLLEHLTQLVHLTAFGTVRQWPEMWEEYIYFKSQFNMAMFLQKGGKKEDFYKLCADIENYIIDLKSDRA